jgi:non-ribosomal peptide synthetase component F
MTLLCAFQVLLSRISGEQDIVVGTDSANRPRLETEGLVGFFINVLALRACVIGKLPFRTLLREVREVVLGAYLHQELPFEVVVEHLHIEREGNRTPLVNVLFVMQNIPSVRVELPGLTINPVKNSTTFAKFELALFMSEDSQGLRGSVNYSTDLFKSETIATLAQRYEALLHSIVIRPTAQIMNLEIATDNERSQKSRERDDLRHYLKMNQEKHQPVLERDSNQPE